MKNAMIHKKHKYRSFAQSLREVRRLMDLTQEEMSKKLGVARASLSLYETGKQMPTIAFLERLYKATNIPFDALMGYSRSLEPCVPVRDPEMTMDDYQTLAARTINKDMSCAEILMHALHEIAAECGEIHGHFQKMYQGHPLDENALMLEVGDLLWGIAELCTVNSWEMSDVARANIDKLRKRYPDGFSAERSLNREKDEYADDSMESDPIAQAIYRTFCGR